jgi:hypothetical protein
VNWWLVETLNPRCLRPGSRSRQLVALSRPAISTARIWRRPSQSMPMAASTARERVTGRNPRGPSDPSELLIWTFPRGVVACRVGIR